MRALLIRSLVSFVLLLALPRPTWADDADWSVGTSAWMLRNAFPDGADFYYLEVDRSLGKRDSLVLEALTWMYHAPIAIPYVSSSYGDSSEDYPGYVRSFGLGVGWRHEFHRGLNTSVRAFHLLQSYHEDDRPRTTGYQLFLQTRVGWRWSPGDVGFWIEPAVGFNWWPIEVGRPDSFEAMDDRWPSYFLFEPWLNMGWRW